MATKVTYTSTALGDETQNTAFDKAVSQARSRVGEHLLLINGERRAGGDGSFELRNPADQDEMLGTFAVASSADVSDAIRAARAAAEEWRATSYAERARILRRGAQLIRGRVAFLGAVVALEVGKNRVESVGEVEESADLVDEYCRQMEAAEGFVVPMKQQTENETNTSVLKPFGVFGVIAPFNFPSALSAGPIAGALVAGNTVVYKPASTAPWSGVLLVAILHEAGLPAGVLNLVTGHADVGRAIVGSPDVDGIVFTGSYAVGQEIFRRFAQDRGYARPCITEMGGKNPAIVMPSADLDRAAEGIARSAFGASGQKCSACSRVIVHQDTHDALVARLAEQAQAWSVRNPIDPECRLGPVNNRAAYEAFLEAADEARRDGRIVAGGEAITDGDYGRGFYVQPTVVTGLPEGHRLTRDELFVPFVVVEPAASLDQALERANDQLLGLTAGIFSEDESEINRFLDRIEAGVVYVNRAAGATTGAWPGFQSFAGWKGSGSTGKGGLGPYYVQQFLREQSQTIVR